MDPFGDNGTTLGIYNEWRVYYAIKKLFQTRPWFISVRKAHSEYEEANGRDVILTTKSGKIYFQVKSSIKEGIKFQSKQRGGR